MNANRRPVWQDEMPDEEGFWFIKTRGGEISTRIIVKRDGDLRVCATSPYEFGTALRVYNFHGTKWAGPIPMPVERIASAVRADTVVDVANKLSPDERSVAAVRVQGASVEREDCTQPSGDARRAA